MRFRRAVLLFGVFGVFASVGMSGAVPGSSAATPATGYLYWGHGSAIGRASLDGTGVNKSFISTGGSPVGVAVDASYIYWMRINWSPDSASIGRANLDGTGVNQNFINLPFSNNRDASYPGAMTVDGSHIYWADPDGAGIGRASLNGTGVDLSFIGSVGEVSGLAVDGNYIYWSGPGGAVGRANLNGTSVNKSFITVPADGVAVDGNYVYWTTDGHENGTPRIGRANLDGAGVNPSFISGAGVTGYPFGGSGGLAVDGDSIFWAGDSAIGRANIDGSCQGAIVSGIPSTVAVTPGITTSPPVKYAVTYSENGATGGSAPVDASSPYNCAATVTVRGPGTLTRPGFVFNGWDTTPGAFGGGFGSAYRPGRTFSMPASNVTLYAQWAKKLSAGTTFCNRTFTGTGGSVVVPAGSSCTLIPGTHVKNTIVVKANGVLQVRGVTIGGTLTTYGNTRICGSKIGGGVVATGPAFWLGGPSCAGNHVSGDILVRNIRQNGPVWVAQNTVTGSLTLKYIRGSIVGNIVSGNLLVEYSGPPVDVRGNHAATARCVNNTGQTGSGNVAKSTNTCPH
jgi:uncharacterized repeat protein (TIGR02543 family)